MGLQIADQINGDDENELQKVQNQLNRSIMDQKDMSNDRGAKLELNTKLRTQAVTKIKLSNGMEVFDFNEEIIIAKMEALMSLLD